MKTWCVYIVKCIDGSLYTGATNSLKERIDTHNAGRGAKYTRARRPVHLVWSQPSQSRGDALAVEIHVKGLTRQQKLQMIQDQQTNHLATGDPL